MRITWRRCRSQHGRCHWSCLRRNRGPCLAEVGSQTCGTPPSLVVSWSCTPPTTADAAAAGRVRTQARRTRPSYRRSGRLRRWHAWATGPTRSTWSWFRRCRSDPTCLSTSAPFLRWGITSRVTSLLLVVLTSVTLEAGAGKVSKPAIALPACSIFSIVPNPTAEVVRRPPAGS